MPRPSTSGPDDGFAPDVDDVAAPADAWQERLSLLVGRTENPSARSLVGAVALAVVALAVAVVVLRPPPGPAPEAVMPMAGAAPAAPVELPDEAPADVAVHAAGAVLEPGVYHLAGTARVGDLVDLAGGAAADADLDRLNLAATLVDGERVYVPRRGEPVPAVEGGGATAPGGGGAGGAPALVDVNTADAAQLETLPGVGPATAAAILDERERRGRFGAVDELLDVRGIGDAKLAALRDLVVVS